MDQKRAAVGEMAVGKLQRAVCTVLVKMIHNPHLVNHRKGLVEEHKETHSTKSDKSD